jgi:hypothetical protein
MGSGLHSSVNRVLRASEHRRKCPVCRRCNAGARRDSGCTQASRTDTRGGCMTIMIALITVAAVALTVVELWMLWKLGERSGQGGRARRQTHDLGGDHRIGPPEEQMHRSGDEHRPRSHVRPDGPRQRAARTPAAATQQIAPVSRRRTGGDAAGRKARHEPPSDGSVSRRRVGPEASTKAVQRVLRTASTGERDTRIASRRRPMLAKVTAQLARAHHGAWRTGADGRPSDV